jgi:hypothetical protein
MRRFKAFRLLLVLAMIAAACGGDTGDSTTTEATTEGSTTTSQDTTTTEGSTTTDPKPQSLAEYVETFKDDPTDVCYYSQYHLFTPEGEGDDVVDLLVAEGVDSLNGYVVDPIDGYPTDIVETPLDGDVDIVTISPGNSFFPNPYVIVQWLREQAGHQATVVHAIGMAGHWQLKPGSEAVSADEADLWGPSGSPQGTDYIAVVDSGLVDTRRAERNWVLDGVVDGYATGTSQSPLVVDTGSFGDSYGLSQVNGAPVSHGTFIVSLLRQIVSPANVVFAGMGGWEKFSYFNSWPEDNLNTFDTTAISHEVAAYSAIDAIINGHSNLPIRALNLSWGTYPCEVFLDGEVDDGLGELEALRATLAAWAITFPDAPIFAAGGNEAVFHGPFLPAAAKDVLGIGATSDPAGTNPIVWDDAGDPVSQPAASGQFFAAGCDLVGVGSGDRSSSVIAWGGSSFATAVASASWVLNGSTGIFDQTMIIDDVPISSSPRC